MNNRINHVMALLAISLLFVSACTSSQLTGNAVGQDACKSLNGAAKDDCYFDTGQCSKIGKESVRNVCVAELGIKKLDLSVCDLITSGSAKGYCKFGIAASTNEVNGCKAIEDGYWKDNCHLHYAVNNQDGVFCAAINSPEQQQDCFFQVAVDTNNADYCSPLPDNRADECMYQIAQSTKDISLCEQVIFPLSRDTCKLKLASRILMDESLCDTIKAGAVKDVCHERFNDLDKEA